MPSRAATFLSLWPSFVLVFMAPSLSGAPSPTLENMLHEIFLDHAFDVSRPPQVQWLDDGAAYTVLEESSDIPDAKDIVRYTSASGKRETLVSGRSLTPQGETKPLTIDGYDFSKDKQHALIFTNTKPVWRQKTRGDYWLLDLNSKVLQKFGREW
jgi:dipeptidyl-peptidase-4